ncbi:MAG: acetyltransferase [Anaerolineales bacterium]
MRVIVIGAGGHGQVVADALLASCQSCPDLRVLGYADDDEHLWGQTLGGLPVLGCIAAALDTPHDAVIVAIGDNRVRYRVMSALLAQGECFVSVVHPAATVSPGASIGFGAMVLAGAVVNTGARLGAGVIVNTSASVDHHNRLEDWVHLAPGAHTGGEVTIGRGALVGLGASIAPRCTIGCWATVGAGATVIHDVPAGTTVVGTPARVIKQIEVLP